MMKSISLLKPSLNPEFLTRGSNLSLFLVAKNPRASFRLLPHAQASGSGRNVWEEAAEEFFRAKGEKPAIKEAKTPGNKASNYGDARSGRREWDEKDRSVRQKNVGPSSGSQYKKAVSFAGREWGDEERRGSEGSGPQYKKAASFAGREWGDEGGRTARDTNARSSKPAWSNKNSTATERRSAGPNGYKSDRGGGYGRRGERDGDEEGDDEASEDWPKREAVNWRLEGEPLYGVAPIRAAFLAERREFHTLYVQESLVENVAAGKRKDKQAVNWILNRAHNLEIKVETVSKQNLNLLVDNRPHQGLVLDASPLELVPCEYLERPDGSSPVWVALDEVIDPQNFGAILRSCHYLGATGVIVCAKNSAPLSGVVSKASAGALEVMEIQSCRNMMKFLETSVLNGWRAVGASSEPRALPIQELEPGLPTILVLGNEGRGLRTNVKRSCTELVSIKGFGLAGSSPPVQEIDSSGSEFQAAAEAVDSLNVSVAAGILLHDLLSRSHLQRMPAE